MSADFWLNLQVRWDLYKAEQSESAELEAIQDFHQFQKIPLGGGWGEGENLRFQ